MTKKQETTKYFIAIVILVVVIAGTILIFTQKEEEVIKIGAVFPLTGGSAVFGVPSKNAVELAAQEINVIGGVNGRLIEIIPEDDACSPTNGINAVQKLINVDDVHIILGSACSGPALSMAPIAEENQRILITFGAAKDLSYAGDYVFRLSPSVEKQAEKVAEHTINQGYNKIGLIAEITSYAQSLKDLFKEKYTGQIVFEEGYNPEETDFRTLLVKIKDMDVDAIYIIAQQPRPGIQILKQMKELEMAGIPLISNDINVNGNIDGPDADLIEGIVFAEADFTRDKQFYDKYTSIYGEENYWGAWTEYSYDAMYLVKEALDICEENTDCIKNHLYSISGYKGVSGIITIDENGDAQRDWIMKRVESGKKISIE